MHVLCHFLETVQFTFYCIDCVPKSKENNTVLLKSFSGKIFIVQQWNRGRQRHFNGTGTALSDWFLKDRVLKSSWSDLANEAFNYFSIDGEKNNCRARFREF